MARRAEQLKLRKADGQLVRAILDENTLSIVRVVSCD